MKQGLEKADDWTDSEVRQYAGKYRAVTLPVHLEIQGKQHVLSFTEVEKILLETESIALGECYCRKKIQGCNSPLDTCISLDEKAEELISKGLAARIQQEDAFQVLRRAHEAGLVQITYSIAGKKQPAYICSCCSCCCHSLGGPTRFGMLNAVLPSEYVSIVDAQRCTNCSKCIQRCQFGARTLRDRKLSFDTAKCFGCGLCVTTCPSRAIKLVLRGNETPSEREEASDSQLKPLSVK